MSGPVEVAQSAWGQQLPDWVALLARECEAASQSKVAKRMNRSPSLVSALLRNKYKGDMVAVEEVVRGVFMKATVDCPALGQLSSAECRDWMVKARKFSNENSERVRLFKACRGCSRYRQEPAHAE